MHGWTILSSARILAKLENDELDPTFSMGSVKKRVKYLNIMAALTMVVMSATQMK